MYVQSATQRWFGAVASNCRSSRFGVDTGTLAEPSGPQFTYTEAGPVNWASGFVVLTYREGRLLEPELCVVHRGNAWFRSSKIGT
jgi:hypothetical protein